MLKTLLLELLEELERVGHESRELYDTDIRESLFETVFNGFVRPIQDFNVPDSFGLKDAQADQAVSLALARYIKSARAEATRLGLTTVRERLRAFQDGAVHTGGEGQYPDDFFGWIDPETIAE